MEVNINLETSADELVAVLREIAVLREVGLVDAPVTVKVDIDELVRGIAQSPDGAGSSPKAAQ